ncbi:MAG TPA: hypothetical protein VFY31_05675 [Macromonas sp.]|nr:hypothetical protein [Macromonas sp.]
MEHTDFVHRVPPRPEYGQGLYIRSLAIVTPAPGVVAAALEDSAHAFELEFTHDQGIITSVRARWFRHPFTSCSGVEQTLAANVGHPLGGHLLSVMKMSDRVQQCTHQYDLFCLAVTHAFHGREDRRYDVVITDPVQGDLVPTTLYLNGQPVLEWLVKDYEQLVSPEHCRGVNTMKGFTSWVKANIPPEQHELYFMAQRAWFVARTQKLDIESMEGQPAPWSGPPAGNCHGTQPQRYASAVRTDNSMRRFTPGGNNATLAFFDHPMPPGAV